ncbi:MAG TPA: hypothetical protein DEF72_02625 [Gammaproteobacteria bacterium]|nr:hypothetical protein [Gammaproteobacteria bacterium]
MGLLEQISARQIISRRLELSEIREIFEIREMLEAHTTSLTSIRLSDENCNELEDFSLKMRTTPTGSPPDYFDLNIAVHSLIH